MTTKLAGYDKLAVNRDLLLDLQFREGVGEVARDYAKPHHPVTRNPGGSPGGPAWIQLANGLTVLDFEGGTPDWLECPQADTVDLDFTAGDFSFAVWMNPDSVSDAGILVRGQLGADGWYSQVNADGSIGLYTCQAGASQWSTSIAAAVVAGTWSLIGATRSGASVRIYKNGPDVTESPYAHINPLASTRDLHIGIADNEIGSFYDGKMWRPRIWGRCLSAEEMAAIFEMERALFGV